MNKFILLAMMVSSTLLFSAEGPSIKPNGCKGPVLCPSSSIYERISECDSLWNVSVGLLYEQPWMSDMGSGAVAYGESIYQSSSAAYDNAEIFFLEECFDYSLGITAGLGYLMKHDNWFLLANFNWLSSGLSSAYSDAGAIYYTMGFYNDQVVSPNISAPSNLRYDSIDYKANLDIYDLNVTLSRGSFHSKCFSFESFGGIKALWYNGYQQRRYYSVDHYGSHNIYQQAAVKYDAWGAGPVFGFNSEYFITHSASVFIDSDIAVLYGGINSTNTSLFFNPGVLDNDTQGVATYRQNFKQPYFLPVRSIIGLKFGKYCLEDKHYIALRIGYDARYVLVDSGLKGQTYGGSGLHHGNSLVPINGYNVASNGLYTDFIWNF